MRGRIAVIGECMLELSHSNGNSTSGALPTALSYGGDTLNTAVYMSRLGVAVDYVTALGDDSMSDWMVDQWLKEGVGCDMVERCVGSVPGLYMIQTDTHGERSFYYWRENAPVRQLFDSQDRSDRLLERLASYDWLYLSGITLALFRGPALERFFSLLEAYRNRGGKIAFDGNYRPQLWPEESAARQAYQAVLRLAEIALPTLEDEQMLFGDESPDAVVHRLQSWGVVEVAIKMGSDGCLVANDQEVDFVPARRVEVVDTTSAGDSFNAAYLAARITGAIPRLAAEAGHDLASIVIQHRGAIIPVEEMR